MDAGFVAASNVNFQSVETARIDKSPGHWPTLFSFRHFFAAPVGTDESLVLAAPGPVL